MTTVDETNDRARVAAYGGSSSWLRRARNAASALADGEDFVVLARAAILIAALGVGLIMATTMAALAVKVFQAIT